MDEDVRQFREALLAEVNAEATTGGDYQRTRFVDRTCQILEEAEELDEYGICHVTGDWKRSRLAGDAYGFSEADGILNLIVADFSGDQNPQLLMTEDVKRIAGAAYRFLEASVYSDAASCWDESHPSHQLAKRIFDFSLDGLTKARIFLLSDREVSPQLGKLPEFKLGSHPVELQIWGIDRLYRADTSTGGRGRILIDFMERYGHGVPALPAALEGSEYRSFMCVVPGGILANLYDRYGGRILEQNVRAFLGDGRKVNRGIRETLRERPEMFFAFNNGLTATASSVDLESGAQGSELRAVADFQVVNGGQTTASLYWAQKAGIDLSRVFVQMKLSVMPEAGFEDAVHDIARYANAQNAVSAADLFAGHPYFKRLEKLSRQILAPPSHHAQNTYWFFERAQGSYNLELKRLKGVAAKFWQVLNPKAQKLSKTDVARYEVTWASLPQNVCQGAQKNIAAFGKLVTERWAENPEGFNDVYYRRLIAKCLLIRAVDKAIPIQSWYPGSILRQLTTYTVALMCERMSQKGLEPDLEAIWKAQAAPPAFVAESMRIAAAVNRVLSNIPEQFVKNRLVTEWVKREACWDQVRGSQIFLSSDFLATLVPATSATVRAVPWQTRSRQLWSNGTFKRLWEWLQTSPSLLSDGEMEAIQRTAISSEFALRGFRLKKLEEAWRKAVDAGFV